MKDKIEEIINKYQIHTSIGIKETIDVCDEWDMKTMGVAINEISTLIQEERKEAVKEFTNWVYGNYNGGEIKMGGDGEDLSINLLCRFYLTQQSLDKGDTDDR